MVRYAAPLTLLSLVVFAPLLWIAWHTPVPADVAAIRGIVKLAWLSLAYVGCAQLLLVGAAAAVVREPRLSQRRALAAGARQLVRAAAPVAIAIAAIIAGGLALAVPGLALLGLLSLTAASDEPGLPAPLLDSARIVARHWRRVAITLVAIGLCDFAIVFVCQRFAIVSPQKKAITAEDYLQVARVVRFASLGFALLSPLAAAALAAIRVSDTRRGASPGPAAPPGETSAPPAGTPIR